MFGFPIVPLLPFLFGLPGLQQVHIIVALGLGLAFGLTGLVPLIRMARQNKYNRKTARFVFKMLGASVAFFVFGVYVVFAAVAWVILPVLGKAVFAAIGLKKRKKKELAPKVESKPAAGGQELAVSPKQEQPPKGGMEA